MDEQADESGLGHLGKEAETMIKGQGVIWSRRRKNVGADTWHSLGITYETILKGFPPFDEKKRKPIVSDKLFQYNRVFRRRRDLRMEGKLSETVKKWQELMA